MSNYHSVKTLAELDEARRRLGEDIDRQGDHVLDSFNDLKDYYTPTNLMVSGLKSISSIIPFDRLLLVAVVALKRIITR